MRALLAALFLAAPGLAWGQAAPDGPALFKRCAACHLATGAGVPGAFPPLQTDVRALAGKAGGRRYLALVVAKGVSGPITVEGKTYRGVMPAQAGLNDAQIAAVLNHVVTSVASGGSEVKPFTAAEIGGHRASAAQLNAAAIGRLHTDLSGK